MYTLTKYLGIFYLTSEFFGFLISATSNFIFNKIWTFKEKMTYRMREKYINFFLVSLITLSLNLLLLHIFTEFLGIYYIISEVMAIGISLIVNFIGNKIWTFRNLKQE